VVDTGLAIYNSSGGDDVRKIEQSSDASISVLLQERGPAPGQSGDLRIYSRPTE
jgi:hypothetical protein